MGNGGGGFDRVVGDELDPGAVTSRLRFLDKEGLAITGKSYSPTVAIMPELGAVPGKLIQRVCDGCGLAATHSKQFTH